MAVPLGFLNALHMCLMLDMDISMFYRSYWSLYCLLMVEVLPTASCLSRLTRFVTDLLRCKRNCSSLGVKDRVLRTGVNKSMIRRKL
jgi:hypothetical protein